MSLLTGKPLLPLALSISYPIGANLNFVNPTKIKPKHTKLSAQIDDSSQPTNQNQQLNLSVLRFTFGISWLDESYLPRWLGYGFGSLIVLNHFVGSSSTVTSAQLVSEALGLSLAAFSITLPFMGKFLKGSTMEEQTNVPERAEQIFVMSPNVSEALKEDLAWTTYIFLRNTKSVSVLVYLQDVICVRGYWNVPENSSKDDTLNWFMSQIKKFGLTDVKETLYFPQGTGSIMEDAIPEGIGSILIQPVGKGKEDVSGFVLLASSINYAFTDKDRSWIQAIVCKFRGNPESGPVLIQQHLETSLQS